LYEGQYLLGTSIARPLIAKRQIEIAEKVGADAVAHGATGKGNDQVRFELSYYALKPDVTVIAPWREWELRSREALIAFSEQHQIPIAKGERGEAPYAVAANLLHASSEGKVLEDPSQEVPDYVYSRTLDPQAAPDRPAYVSIEFERGDAVALDGRPLSPADVLAGLKGAGRARGMGGVDVGENRFVGMKSRGMYETPGGTILLAAHRGIESITLDRGAAHLKDELMPKYAELIYNGFWFTPEREMLQAAIDASQEFVTGTVKLRLYKGQVAVVGRSSPYSLYDRELVTFTEGQAPYHHPHPQAFNRPRCAAPAPPGAPPEEAEPEAMPARPFSAHASHPCVTADQLLAGAARRPQVGRAEGQWLPPVQRIRHVDVDVDELNAGLRRGVPRPAVPPPVAKPNLRHPGEVQAAPVALRRQP